MERTRVVIVGAGFMGRMHAAVYALFHDAEVVAVVDRRAEKAEAIAGPAGARVYDGLTAALAAESPDVLDVCLPTDLHCDATLAGLAAGCHVFCEKPMARDLESADRMAEAAERSGRKLMIGHCIRFWPEYALLKRIVDDGRLGALRSLNLTRYGEFPSWSADGWLADEARSGGGVLDMHIHDTDYALYLLGEPEEVSAWGTLDARGPSHAFTTMRYPGLVVHTEGGWNLPPGTPFRMAFRAVFDHGAAIMDGGPMTVYAEGRGPEVPQFPRMSAAGGGNISDLGGYYHELRYFVDCVRHDRPLETVTPATSRLSLKYALDEIAQIKSRR